VDNGSDTTEVVGTVPTGSAGPQCPKCCEPAGLVVTPGLFRPTLSQQSMTFSVPLPPPCSATSLIAQDPRQALADIKLTSIAPAPDCPQASDPNQPPPPCQIPSLFTFDDLTDPTGLAKALAAHADTRTQFLLGKLSAATQTLLAAWDGKSSLPAGLRAALVADLSAMVEVWSPQRDLLESGPDDASFVVEMDNDGFAHLRFGDGVSGRQPEAGTLFKAGYRIGNGTAGNVGRDTITYVVLRSETLSGVALQPTNPLAASGGVDPEPIDAVKQFAPYAFRSQIERAITAEDYAALASDNARRLLARASLEVHDPEICAANFTPLQGAKAALRWNGSWYTALVALDPRGSEDTDAELVEEVTEYLEPFRRMGEDLLVSPATYVPIKLAMTVCVLPNYQRGHVEAAALDALSDRALPDGALGFFHPDNLTFGADIYVSRLLATVQAIPGVQNCMVTELERLDWAEFGTDAGSADELPIDSALRMGPFEIAQLDNDPSFPENGLLVLDVRGGR
jgi:predicted phage baseplate assembly protein